MTKQKTVAPKITVGGLPLDSHYGCNALSARYAQYRSAARKLSDRLQNPLFSSYGYDLVSEFLRMHCRPSPAVRKFFENLRICSLVNTSTLPAVGSFPSERFDGAQPELGGDAKPRLFEETGKSVR